MAAAEVVCPHCDGLQRVPEKRLQQPWVCLNCKGTIDDPFLHKKKSPPPKLEIPLHGKIITTSGITNLSEIVASSEEFSKGFDPSTIMIPGSFDLGAYTAQTPGQDAPRGRSRKWLAALALLLAVILVAVLVWLVVLPMMSQASPA